MKKTKLYLCVVIAAALITLLIASGPLKRVDRWVQDGLFQRPGVSDPNIVIIGIDELALDVFGPYNTWDRNIMASALEKLAADPEKMPAAVAVDILYAGQSTPQADARLAAAADRLNCVVTASMAEFGEEILWENGRAAAIHSASVTDYIEPYDQLKACTRQGHINAMLDTDGVMRHALMYVDLNKNAGEATRVYSMAYQTAATYCERTGQSMQQPDMSANGQFYLSYTAKPGGYSDDVSIAMLIAGRVPADYWAGKIVLIGPYAAALQDAYFTPIDSANPMYGVEIQANQVQSLLQGRFPREVSDLPQLLGLFVICAAAMLFFLKQNVAHGGWLCAVLMAVGLLGSILLHRLGLITHPLWIISAVPVLYIAALIRHYVTAAKERRALALEKERISAELALATRIQSSALIKNFPAFPERKEFDLYAAMYPAKEVGGDLYDFFMPDEDHLTLVIGDVSGKGIPAALFMMVTMALLRHVAMRELNPARALEIVNDEICARNPEEMFVTVWIGVLELSTGKMLCANAGHEYPVLKQADGSFELVKDRHGLVIGGMPGMRYREYELSLRPGSKLFVYTDGVPEATNAREEMFGAQRLTEVLRANAQGTPEQISDAVREAVQAFVGEAPQFDDLTMLCLTYCGEPL